MTMPPLLLGASLLFWGWQTGMLPVGAAAAVLVEAARLVRFRIDLAPVDFRRITDFNSLMLAALLVFVFLSNQTTPFIFIFLQWIPIALLPMILAQLYSTVGKIDPGAIFWSLRKSGEEGGQPMTGMDLRYPYLVAVILASGSANMRTPWFYAAVLIIFAVSLWPHRSRRHSPALWFGLLALAGLVGFGGHLGLHRMQLYLADVIPQWLLSQVDRVNTYRSMTSIGDVGALKLSDKILFRVEQESGQSPPDLLRRASFNLYVPPTWVATQTRFTPVSPEKVEGNWSFGPAAAGRDATIIDALRKGEGVLKLPTGCYAVRDLPAGYLDRNIYGAVRVYEAPGLVRYRVLYAEKTVLDSPPEAGDLAVPAQEKDHIARIARELNLTGEPPPRVLAKIGDFFRENFRYSLILRTGEGKGALEHFLTRSRAGHCEFFATATVLLLREAGVPARYATGFSVQDFSRLEGLYVVRARHAHAWAIAYVNGSWRDLDTTPSGWAELESQNASFWAPVADFWSWLGLKVSEWKGLGQGGLEDVHFVAIALLFALVAFWYLRRRSLRRVAKRPQAADNPLAMPGMDSEFYQLEKFLIEEGHIRQPWEPITAWLARIEGMVTVDRRIVEIHYRLRFDPEGVPGPDRALLKSSVESWIKERNAERQDKGG